MDTISDQSESSGRRRRRLHSAEFKADVVAACAQAGISIAAVAMSRGINANLLRRWVQASEGGAGNAPAAAVVRTSSPPPPAFVPLSVAAQAIARDIRIELRKGATTVAVTWPTEAAGECAAWLRELLR